MVDIKKEKLQPPRGMRDFTPSEMAQRQYIMDTIRRVYEAYGFLPIETPALEHYEVLSAKCGQDTMDQIYQFKDRGDRELGLRYDLTVPTARVIASNPSIQYPFKRYYISRVWRYENPQMGRYREFWQADIDTYGVSTMDAEIELLATAIEALKELGFKRFIIRMNNRKLLTAFMEVFGVPPSKVDDVFRIIDKLDKIGSKDVRMQLAEHLETTTIDKILGLLEIKGPASEILQRIRPVLQENQLGSEGVTELEQIYAGALKLEIADYISVDLSLVRGLDYYTGPVFEVQAQGYEDLGSLAGGGRYDNLIAILGGVPTPAVGIALGIERIWPAMNRLELLQGVTVGPRVMVVPVSDETRLDAMSLAQELRKAGIPTEFELMHRKLKRVLQSVSENQYKFLVILGPKDVEQGIVTIRDLHGHTQMELKQTELRAWIQAQLPNVHS